MSSVWSIVLAAGSGRRLAAVTGGVPKQFWTGAGSVSLLERTLARVRTVTDAAHTVTIVDAEHAPFVSAVPWPIASGQIVFQPCDRGTATGVALALASVLRRDPDAIVLLTPSDHGVGRPGLFTTGVRQAIRRVRTDAATVVVFGVEPTTADPGYGWITSAELRGARFRRVDAFVEKPAAEDAARLMRRGAMWNTMVLVATARTLHTLFAAPAPHLARFIADFARVPAAAEKAHLAACYADFGTLDFSRHVLTPARNLVLYEWPASMGWADLGTPRRLAEWLEAALPSAVRDSAPASRDLRAHLLEHLGRSPRDRASGFSTLEMCG